MSSYNIKWVVIYLLYALSYLWYCAELDYWDLADTVGLLVICPTLTYLLLPLVLKKLGHWKIIKWSDRVIDTVYNLIKEKFI